MHTPLILPMTNGPPTVSLPENAESVTLAAGFMQLLERLMAENELPDDPSAMKAALLESLEVEPGEDQALQGQIAAFMAMFAAQHQTQNDLQSKTDAGTVADDPVDQNDQPGLPFGFEKVPLSTGNPVAANIDPDHDAISVFELVVPEEGKPVQVLDSAVDEVVPQKDQNNLEDPQHIPKMDLPSRDAVTPQDVEKPAKAAIHTEVDFNPPQPERSVKVEQPIETDTMSDPADLTVERPTPEMAPAPEGDSASTENPDLQNDQIFATHAKAVSSTPVEPTRNGEVVSQVFRAVETMVQDGSDSLQIHLHPEELGAIKLKLTSGEDGLQVNFRADSLQTQVLLERHLGELRQHLSRAGINLDQLSVGAQGHHHQPQDAPDKQSRRSPNPMHREAADVDIHDQEAQGVALRNYGVDYRI